MTGLWKLKVRECNSGVKYFGPIADRGSWRLMMGNPDGMNWTHGSKSSGPSGAQRLRGMNLGPIDPSWRENNFDLDVFCRPSLGARQLVLASFSKNFGVLREAGSVSSKEVLQAHYPGPKRRSDVSSAPWGWWGFIGLASRIWPG